MKLSHVKIKRRRARRLPTQYPEARHDPPVSKAAQPLIDAGWEWKHGEGFVPPPDYDEYADLNSRLQEAGLRRLLRATDRICSRHEPADAAVCSIVPESDPNPA